MSVTISQDELTEIVKRAQNGSPEDFQKLYNLFARAIYNFIWRLTGSVDDAQDLTQDTFLKVHRELKHLREPAQFRFWLYRVARNEVYQRLRRQQRNSEVSIDDEEITYYNFLVDGNDSLNPERQFLNQELQEIIDKALNTMAPKYRDVFILAVFEKMSYEDITKIVGRSLLSVKTDIYRARLIAKDVLKKYLRSE
ncbi:MAG: sigma-70 family RNA polymerase sigma factor [Acidobacteria bacterium]|nr:sigma-70 family RNA polymerase sigma factor [Acidobacteriota bacterium]